MGLAQQYVQKVSQVPPSDGSEADKLSFLVQYNASSMCLCVRCRTTINVHWQQKRTELSLKCKYRRSSIIAVCFHLYSLF